MNILWEFLLSNAILVTVMAAVVILVSRWISNAHVVRGLWLLVLVKLVTPPVYSYPVELPWGNTQKQQVEIQNEQQPSAISSESIEMDGSSNLWKPKGSESRDRDIELRLDIPKTARESIASSDTEQNSTPAKVEKSAPIESTKLVAETTGRLVLLWNTIRDRLGNFVWSRTLVTVWIAGSLFCLGLFLFRVMKLLGLLKGTVPAPEHVREKTKRLAESFGLKKVPEVRMTNERVSPFVWGTPFGTEIVLPRRLIMQISDEAQTTLIAHELSHLKRNDHLFRWLEAAVTFIYWWHPVVWWAKRKLHELEEITCDATVVAQFPNVAKTYAHALMDTVDFLSGAKPFRPPLACGIAPVLSLRKRITCIMKNNRRPAVTWWGRLIVVAAAFSLLPFSVSSAQKKSESDEASKTIKKALEEANKAIKEAEALIQKSKDKNNDQDKNRRTRRSRSSWNRFDKADFKKQLEQALKQARSAGSQVDQKKIRQQIRQALKQVNQADIHKHIEKAMKHARKHFDSKKIRKQVQQALKHAQKAQKNAINPDKLRKHFEKALERAKAEGKDYDEKEVREKFEKALKAVEKIKIDIDFSSIEKSVESALKAAESAMKQFEKKDFKDLEKKIQEALKNADKKGVDFERIEEQIEEALEEIEELIEGIEENFEEEVEKALEKHEADFEKVEEAIEKEIEPILEEIKTDLGYDNFINDDNKGFTTTFRKEGKILEGSGKEKTETRKVGNFNFVHIGGCFVAEISQGGKHSVTVSGDDNLLEFIETSVKDGKLVVIFSKRYKADHPELRGIHTKNKFKVKITAPSFESIGVSGASHATVSDVKADSFGIHVNGASNVKLTGECKNFSVHCAGASVLDASGMKAGDVTAHASGASRTKISASKSLKARASGASRIQYSGNPESVSKKKSGVAKIVKAKPSA